ncbi:Arm DNA-binding domain-containing protein [Granulicella arctica]
MVRQIDTAKLTIKQYKLADGRGLCLLVMPMGAKYWRRRYRFDGTEKMMSLGEVTRGRPQGGSGIRKDIERKSGYPNSER